MSNRLQRRAAKRASFQQQNANRENAQFSTGPTTVEGKAASSMNATKHGLTSMRPYLPAEEQTYLAFAAGKTRRYDPQTAAEQELVSTIIDVEWRLKRIPALEARVFADDEADPHKTVRSLDTLSRHETRLRKLLINITTQFQALVEMRRKYEQARALAAQKDGNGFVLKTREAASKQDLGEPFESEEIPYLGQVDGMTETYSEAV